MIAQLPPIGKSMKVKNTTETIANNITKVEIMPEVSFYSNKIIVAIELGPAINGVARGKTDGSSLTSISVCSSRRCPRFLKSILTAVTNRSKPPDILKATRFN
jgi:hypothetical protein